MAASVQFHFLENLIDRRDLDAVFDHDGQPFRIRAEIRCNSTRRCCTMRRFDEYFASSNAPSCQLRRYRFNRQQTAQAEFDDAVNLDDVFPDVGGFRRSRRTILLRWRTPPVTTTCRTEGRFYAEILKLRRRRCSTSFYRKRQTVTISASLDLVPARLALKRL
jgi:hypothetical protein